MRILKIISDTIVDGPHLRTSIYVSGCKHNCKGCHNPESWDFNAGQERDLEDIVSEILRIDNKYITISGGDPIYSAKDCYKLCKRLKEEKPGINIWIYTGFTLESLLSSSDNYILGILELIDGLVDGPFIEKLKDKNLMYRGSSNQGIWEKDKNGNWIKSKLWK